MVKAKGRKPRQPQPVPGQLPERTVQKENMETDYNAPQGVSKSGICRNELQGGGYRIWKKWS